MKAELLRACRALLPQGGILYCAVSGGPDSVALLHGLHSLQDELGIELRAAHFNHGLRGEAADRDEAFVRRLCSGLGVPLTVGRGDTLAQVAQSDDSTEEAARRLRYRFFDTLPGTVATAHTADDNLETLLINLLRGTSLAGLAGIPPARGHLIRPLLGVSRAEILQYLQQQALPYVLDETNDTDVYLRNRLRRHVVPLLKAENPALLHTVLEMTARLRTDEAYLQALAREALETAHRSDGYDCGSLSAQPGPVLHRAALLLLNEIPDRTARHVQALCDLITSPKPSASIDLPGGRCARREYSLLRLDRAKVAAIPCTQLTIPGQTTAGSLIFTCSAEPFAGAQALFWHPREPLFVRSRQPGDRIRLSGGSRSLKRLLIDRKIPAVRRDSLPVICGKDDIRAVLGVAAAQAEPDMRQLFISYKEKHD